MGLCGEDYWKAEFTTACRVLATYKTAPEQLHDQHLVAQLRAVQIKAKENEKYLFLIL